MHGATLVLLLVAALSGCAKSPPADAARAKASPSGSPDPAPSSVAVAAISADAGAPRRAAVATPTHDDLRLVAVGKTWGAKLLWLSTHGSRVWLSGRNVDAVADGDGPLVKETDPLRGLPYDAKRHVLLIAGMHPRLYVLRYERREVPSQPAHPAVFVRGARGWSQAQPLKSSFLPVDFLPWGEGALVVHSQIGPSIPAGLPSRRKGGFALRACYGQHAHEGATLS